MSTAILTGGSKGLGRALASELAARGWSLVVDGRDAARLEQAGSELSARLVGGAQLVLCAGDITDPAHRHQLVAAARTLGGLDLLVNNASALGPSPLPALRRFPLDSLRDIYETDVVAPLALIELAMPLLEASAVPRVLNLSSDAAVEAYPGWGGYGSAKAALDQLSAVLAAEEERLRVWWLDPGDLRTDMHQLAFPGEDISDRPLPESVAPLIADLVESNAPSGRYRAVELASAREAVELASAREAVELASAREAVELASAREVAR